MSIRRACSWQHWLVCVQHSCKFLHLSATCSAAVGFLGLLFHSPLLASHSSFSSSSSDWPPLPSVTCFIYGFHSRVWCCVNVSSGPDVSADHNYLIFRGPNIQQHGTWIFWQLKMRKLRCPETSVFDCPMTQHNIAEECITLSRNVWILLPNDATSCSRRIHYVVPKRRDFIAQWRNVVFQKNSLRCPETSGFYCPMTQRLIPEEFITLSRNVGIWLPNDATSYSRRIHYIVPKLRDLIAQWQNVVF